MMIIHYVIGAPIVKNKMETIYLPKLYNIQNTALMHLGVCYIDLSLAIECWL